MSKGADVIDLGPLLAAASNVLQGFLQTLSFEEKAVLLARLAEGARTGIEIFVNPDSFANDPEIRVVLTSAKGDRDVLAAVEIVKAREDDGKAMLH
ncbi:MAG: hypothetical protein AB1591_02770 [Pseudomonadota bacterium]